MTRGAEVGGDERRTFYEALQELLRIYQFRDRDRVCYGEITPHECYALAAIERGDGISVCGLAAELGLHKSNASRIVDALEAKGHVRRVADPSDGRGVRVAMTDDGLRVHAAIRARVEAAHAEILAAYAPEHRREFVRLLGDLAREAARRIGAQPTCAGTSRERSKDA